MRTFTEKSPDSCVGQSYRKCPPLWEEREHFHRNIRRAGGDDYSLFVRDYGIGVPEEERERTFDVLYRGIQCGHLSGSGVGLALVQKIASLYGGRVSVDETHGGGATFCLELKVSEAFD